MVWIVAWDDRGGHYGAEEIIGVGQTREEADAIAAAHSRTHAPRVRSPALDGDGRGVIRDWQEIRDTCHDTCYDARQ